MINKNECVEGCDIPSTPNDIKILLTQIKREIKTLATTTEAKLLRHDRKNSRNVQIYKRQFIKFDSLST